VYHDTGDFGDGPLVFLIMISCGTFIRTTEHMVYYRFAVSNGDKKNRGVTRS